MRHGLILAAAMALALSACTLRAPHAGTDAAPEAAGLTAETIEVTPLDGAPASGLAASGLPAPAEPEGQPQAAEETIPVQAASASSPHPRSRPGAVAEGSAAPDSDAAEAAPPEPVKSPQQQLCEAGRGVWGQSPDTGAFLCQKRTSDAGKICRQKGDCQGECLARSGTCAPVAPLLGCNDILDDQGREMTQCLD
jgi:hypothetical protein